MKHKFSIYVPSTVDVNNAADNSAAVADCLAFLSSNFGGATALQASGAWLSESAGLVSENVTICYAFTGLRGRLFRRRQVLVELSTGRSYKIKRAGAYAVVLPPCQDGERSVLKHVYNAVWPWLESASDNAAAYDRGTKKAVAQVANFLEWTEPFAGDGLDKYNWIAEHIQTGTDIN